MRDSNLVTLILTGSLVHNGDEALRQYIANAALRTAAHEDTRGRVVKKSPRQKVDGAVALSMATNRCLYLNLV